MPVLDPFGPLDEAHGFIDPLSPEKDLRSSAMLTGIFIGLTTAVLTSVVRASGFLKRPYKFTFFHFLIWLQWSCVTTFGIIEWARFQHFIPPSFAYYFLDILLWCIQTHCLTQIVANRIGILINDVRTRRNLKLIIFAIVCVLNIFVWVGWGPVALQVANPIYAKLLIPFNVIVTGGIMLVDIGLNTFFVIMVRRRLVSLGLKKYDVLVRFNLGFLCVSVALDALTLGLMFMSNKGIYLHIYPIAYVIKLAIELSLSNLIVKIAAEKTPHHIDPDTVSRLSNTKVGIASHVRIDVDQEVDSIKSNTVAITPSFGQLIRRPDFVHRDSDLVHYPGQYDLDFYETESEKSASAQAV